MAPSSIRVGMEIEMLLNNRQTNQPSSEDLEPFANDVVKFYNQSAPQGYPRMHEDIEGMYESPNAMREWSVREGSTIEPDNEYQCAQFYLAR